MHEACPRVSCLDEAPCCPGVRSTHLDGRASMPLCLHNRHDQHCYSTISTPQLYCKVVTYVLNEHCLCIRYIPCMHCNCTDLALVCLCMVDLSATAGLSLGTVVRVGDIFGVVHELNTSGASGPAPEGTLQLGEGFGRPAAREEFSEYCICSARCAARRGGRAGWWWFEKGGGSRTCFLRKVNWSDGVTRHAG